MIDLADLEWCRARLYATARGVLSARAPGRPPVGLDVGYTMDESRVVITFLPIDDEMHLLVGREVTLALTGRTDDGVRWVVRLTGLADLAASRRRHPAYGLVPALSDALLIPVYRLRGYRETVLDEASGAPVDP